jgi:hypothetical protein
MGWVLFSDDSLNPKAVWEGDLLRTPLHDHLTRRLAKRPTGTKSSRRPAPTGSTLGPFSPTHLGEYTMSDVPDTNEPDPQGDLTPPAEASEPAPAPLEARTAVTAIPGLLQALVYAVGATLVAGFLAWSVGEKTYDYYRPPASTLSSRDFTALNREEAIADQKNTAMAFGTFGALLGVLSGAAGGAVRQSIPGGVRAALAGLLLGGTGAALVGYELAPIYARFYSDESPSLGLSFLVRGGIWAVAGMAAGLALGWGWQGSLGIPTALIGGLAGSVCGTVAFEVVNALLFPGDRNDAVIPSSMLARLMACLFVSVGVAVGAVLLGRHRAWPSARTHRAHS